MNAKSSARGCGDDDEDGQIIVGIDTSDTAGRPSGKFIPLKTAEGVARQAVVTCRDAPQG